jgi:hypothetical protein
MDDIKEGSIDLADQTIDLSEIEDAYDEDLESSMTDSDTTETQADEAQPMAQPMGQGMM